MAGIQTGYLRNSPDGASAGFSLLLQVARLPLAICPAGKPHAAVVYAVIELNEIVDRTRTPCANKLVSLAPRFTLFSMPREFSYTPL